MTLAAVSALYRLLSDAAHLESFISTGKKLGFRHPDSLRVVFMYTGIPRLAQELQNQGVEGFSRRLSPDIICHPNYARDCLADVQSNLIRLLRRPKTYELVSGLCPVLNELLAIPAFGWNAYDTLLNDASPRCFGSDYSHELPNCYGRSISQFQIGPDRIDAIFITDVGFRGYYVERLPLQMPEVVPQTFGEELKALDTLVCHALQLFEQCRNRGRDFLRTAPDEMYVQFRREYPKAVPICKSVEERLLSRAM